MATNERTRRLQGLGQRLWLDGASRTSLRNGTLSRYIADLSVTGLRFDLGVFQHAMGSDRVYDDSIRVLAGAELSVEEQFFELALEDLTQAAELLRPLFDASGGEEGWVSLGISPLPADNAAHAIRAASRLHSKAALANLLVQIPGTPDGARAIEEIVFDGIPVDVTLLFSPEHYLAAARAYMSGLERRLAAGLAVGVESVASVVVNRWDEKVKEEVSSRSTTASASPWPCVPTGLIASCWRPIAGRVSPLPAPVRNGWCGRARPRAMPLRATRSMSKPCSRGELSTACPARRCWHSQSTEPSASPCPSTQAMPTRSSMNSGARVSTTPRLPNDCSSEASSRNRSSGMRSCRGSASGALSRS